ncbi:hypothetical protein C8R42DRAFT_718822 [Lentinula raphanica]|nr:hypothetical protein C8R42DRAFT_718822 [Lentinula raphanica]
MVAKALEILGPCWLMAYDIGCSFDGTIRSSSLGPEYEKQDCRTCVNSFHGYSHNAACQQKHHPLNIPGLGLEDLETLERFFSSSNQLASVTRYMSAYRRRVFIDMFLQQWDREKYQNLATMLFNNYVQALDILENEEPAFKNDLLVLGLTETDIDNYLVDEAKHIDLLGSETQEDLYAIEYVELLQRYREINRQLENASSEFRLQIPEDYQFMSPDNSYAANLSEGRRTETQHRYLREQWNTLHLECVKMETAMGIRRWEITDPEYIEAVKLINTRKYQRALEKLHKLVIQRLFELHKMNLSNTGYKMRTHISHALQRRSKAIQNAVKAYNTAALALNPPRDTLDWSKVSHYAFLDQFNILRDTRHSVFDQPWAKPINRSLMKQRRWIERAREEVVWLNVEIRRLHTAILNEGKKFDDTLQRLQGTAIHGPIANFIQQRNAVNSLLLSCIQQIYSLPGFSSNRRPGRPKQPKQDAAVMDTDGLNPSTSSADSGDTVVLEDATASALHNVDLDSDEGDDEDDDELTEGLGAIVDFMSNISV